jgi:RHS repeat-associated protein
VTVAPCYKVVTQAAIPTYSCPAGYALSGTTCSKTVTQAASASYACPAGYTLSGSTCSETLTQSATLSYSCPGGYTLSGTTCSETLTVSATGAGPGVLVAESFTAFGNRRSGESWSGAPSSADQTTINGVSRWGYTGQTVLGVSMGLNHMNGRVQDALTGRFLSPDPNTADPGNTQSWNRYSYVYNNPVTFTDPTGFYCIYAVEGKCPGDGSEGGDFDPGPIDPGPIDPGPVPALPSIADYCDGGGCLDGQTVTSKMPNDSIDAPQLDDDNPLDMPLDPNLLKCLQSVLYCNSPTQNKPAQSQTPHKYVITVPTGCSASNVFSQLQAPGMSAPGAPAAQEGTTTINLFGNNPISQNVNSATMTITNTTLPTHIFYPGTVVIQVAPYSDDLGNSSLITVTGTGTGNYPEFNDLVGEFIFGFGTAGSIATSCSYSPI